MKPKYGSPFPDGTQELLLKSCLFQGNELRSAYMEWKSRVNIDTDIETGSFRQLPLLYYNLLQNQIEDEITPRLKGIYRRSWSKNHFLFHSCSRVLQLLHQQDIRTIILKGIPLSELYFRNAAVRPMADMDIMIPFADREHIYNLLRQHGWESLDEIHAEYHLQNSKSITLVNSEKTELDLHWYPFDECLGLAEPHDFWDRAVPVAVSGTGSLALCPADELLLTFVHGLMPNPEPPVRWITDAMAIINNDEQQVDWERVLLYAEKFSVVIQLKEALQYLKDRYHARIPDEFYSKVLAMKPSLADKLMYRKKGVFIYHPSFKKIFTAYITFLKNPEYGNLFSKHMAFIRYIRKKTAGKPVFRILIFYISVLLKNRKKH